MHEIIDIHFYENIKKLIIESRKQVITYVNTTMLYTYWNIGKMIVEEQGGKTKAKYGNKLITELSKQMTFDFGKGFDERNLRHMRLFYLLFPIWYTVCTELSWSHYRALIKVEEKEIRDFYMEEAIKGNWSVRQLERQIATCAYSRTLANRNNVEKIQNINESNAISNYNPNTVIKDPYMLEFLGLDNNVNYLEKDLEDALINHLQKFLLELGRGFCFVARQKRITFDNEHYFIDLVFYNSILKCYVVIDLKTEKLSHESLGQIDLYRNYYDQEIKTLDDNPTIGLLLVTE
ncbi:MAG: DUF1016 family protein [Erysipelotrichales bacterium]|nr:DUF1016 family protein [Erysipelotrichales bacterium]